MFQLNSAVLSFVFVLFKVTSFMCIIVFVLHLSFENPCLFGFDLEKNTHLFISYLQNSTEYTNNFSLFYFQQTASSVCFLLQSEILSHLFHIMLALKP
jgi:hypothetical protein